MPFDWQTAICLICVAAAAIALARRSWRVIRGGSWGSYPRHTRAAFRRAWDPKNAGHTIGLRCARDAPP